MHPLEEFRDISVHSVDEETLPKHPLHLPLSTELLPPISAQTYVYCEEEDLEAKFWSYEDFVKESARKWYCPQTIDKGRYHESR